MRSRNTKRLITVLIVCCVAILGFYGFRNNSYLRNMDQQISKKPLPKSQEGTEYSHRTPNNNLPLPELQGGNEYDHRTSNHNQPYKGIVYYNGPKNIKEAALTFDDGPDNVFTPKILDILKENNIKATFFIVGTRAQANPDMVKRILNEGHSIGNHSWDHADLDKLSSDKIKSEIKKTDDLLSSIIGYHPSIVRPPYGAADKNVIEEISSMGFNIVDWSVDTRDWAGTPVPIIMSYVKQELQPGGIILQHCAGGKREDLSNTVTALPEIIGYLKSGGYNFVRIPKMLNISSSI